MPIKNKILLRLAMGLIPLMICNCSNESINTNSSVQNDSVYISLTVNTPMSSTRSNPTGGENGDGSEAGINNENTIHSMALFFYKDESATSIESGNGLATLIRVNIDESEIDQATNSMTASMVAMSVKTLTLNIPYHIVVVANGNEDDLSNILKLSDLQTYIAKKAWTAGTTIESYDDFVMTSRFKTSADDVSYTLTGANKKDSPLGINITLERLAARIDLIPQTTSNNATYDTNGKYYSYPIGTTGDYFRLTYIKTINCMNAGTYLLKHIAAANADNTIADGYSLIGTEQPASGTETNYVLDPWTRSKTADAVTMNLDGVSTTVSDFYDNYFNLASTNVWTASENVQQCSSDQNYIMGYTMENTMAQKCQLTKYSTGLLMKGVYVPKLWYVLDGGNLKKEAATAGTTFYAYNGAIYGSTAALAKAASMNDNTVYTEQQALNLAGVETYINGVCYYQYWIRHSNNNDAGNSIMEFAIVRNNIYRVTINSFNGVGTSTPGTTDEKDENMNATIHVIPWSLYQHSTIYM